MANPISTRLTLVSASPRRRELLQKLRIPFDVYPSDAAERWLAPSTQALAEINARRKVERSCYFGQMTRLLLGADTVVVLGRRVFGKPGGVESARRMLKALSGQWHHVITGVHLSGPNERGDSIVDFSASDVSRVRFRSLTDSEVEAYLATEEWKGKAGAYAIQDAGRSLAEAIEGDFDNIVGLPTGIVHGIIQQQYGYCHFL